MLDTFLLFKNFSMLLCYVFDKKGKIHVTIEVRCKIKVWLEVMIALGRGIRRTGYGWTGNE